MSYTNKQILDLCRAHLASSPAELKRFDANTFAFERQLEFVQKEMYEVLYEPIAARRLIPINSQGGAAAQTITYRMWDVTGQAKVISNYADDLPAAHASGQEFSASVKTLGASYHYSVQDLISSAMLDQPLDVAVARGAVLMVERLIDSLAAFGDDDHGFIGFFNHPNISPTSPVTGTWSSATSAQIIGDLNKLVGTVYTQSKGLFAPDTVVLPVALYQLVAQKPIATDNQKSVLASFLENNPWVKNVEVWEKAALADAQLDGPRIVAYRKAPEVCELRIPMEFTELPPQYENMMIKVPCHARYGGFVSKYPLGMAYMDGC